MKVSKQEIEAVTALSPEERYGYFIKRICDWEQVWGLFEDDCIVLNEANPSLTGKNIFHKYSGCFV